MVRKSAMKTHGSHGPSGLDANERQRLLTSFKSSSTDLCKKIAKLAIRIATSHLTFLLPYYSCRLIALDKCPSLRPIGIEEAIMRIIGGTIVKCIETDLKILGWSATMWGSKRRNWTCNPFAESCFRADSEAILLNDEKNAFTSLNSDLALRNIKKLCPFLYHSICNSYREPSNLFINKQTIFSHAVTTQGDPLRCRCMELLLSP